MYFLSILLLIQSLQQTSSFTPALTNTKTSTASRPSFIHQHKQQSNVSTRLPLTVVKASNDDSSSLTPIPTEWKGEVLASLSSIIDPDLNQSIVTLGFIQNLILNEDTRQISFDVELTTPACPVKEEFQTLCEEKVNALSFTNGKAQVQMTSQPPMDDLSAVQVPGQGENQTPLGVSQVKSIIAVSSCKGGVGKSTTSVNLAYALSNLGASVGIFDADVYGPSLPTMVTPDNDAVNFVGRQIAPLSRNGVKLMSFGYVNDGSAVMRGPMVTQLLDQFLSLTYWGPLDYLILDMPPGTGDIQLTLSQKLNITAAVIVTTPQELSFVDVERGIEMFDSVNVPCVSVVENMAYLEVENDDDDENDNIQILDETELKNAFAKALQENDIDVNSVDSEKVTNELFSIVQKSIQKQQKQEKETKKIKIFGEGHKERLSKQWGIEHTYSVPLMDKIAANGDNGTPFILEYPNSPQASIYNELASSVVREVVKVQYAQANSRPTVRLDEEKNVLHFTFGPVENESEDFNSIPSAELRRDCKCAACVEELTGRQILNPEDISDFVKPIKMTPTGNYALSVDWSDGHKSLYPFRQIESLLEERGEMKEVNESEKEVVST